MNQEGMRAGFGMAQTQTLLEHSPSFATQQAQQQLQGFQCCSSIPFLGLGQREKQGRTTPCPLNGILSQQEHITSGIKAPSPKPGCVKEPEHHTFNRNDAWHRLKGVRKPFQQPTDRPDISSDFPHLRSRPIGQQIPAAWLPEWSPHSGSPASAASHCRHQPGAPRPGAIGRRRRRR